MTRFTDNPCRVLKFGELKNCHWSQNLGKSGLWAKPANHKRGSYRVLVPETTACRWRSWATGPPSALDRGIKKIYCTRLGSLLLDFSRGLQLTRLNEFWTLTEPPSDPRRTRSVPEPP